MFHVKLPVVTSPARPTPARSRRAWWPALLAVLLLPLALASCTGLSSATGGSGPVLADGTVYLSSRDGHVLAVEPDVRALRGQFPGSAEWLFPDREARPGEPKRVGAIYSQPLVSGGRLYFGTWDHEVFALNATGGALIWGPFETESAVVGGPALVDDTLCVGDASGRLYFLNAATGQEKRPPFKADGRIWGNLTAADGIVYFGTLSHNFYAVNVNTGAPVWPKPFETGGAIAGTPTVAGDAVYIGSFDRKLYAVDRATGNAKWPRPFKAGNWFWTRPVVEGDTVYAGSLDGRLYALNASDGAKRWEFKADGPILAAPLVAADRILVGTRKGIVYALNRDGGVLWQRDVNSTVLPDMVASADTLYLASRNRELHALDLATGNARWTYNSSDRYEPLREATTP